MTARPKAVNVGKCIDCLRDGVVGRKRPAPHPGPRCFTHHHAIKRTRSMVRKAAHVENNFGITEGEYQQLLRYQGGVCYICRMKPGKKRLAVDHDHSCKLGHDPKKGCRYCVRGLLCRNCNRNILGRLHESVEALLRAVDYIQNPPAKRVLNLK